MREKLVLKSLKRVWIERVEEDSLIPSQRCIPTSKRKRSPSLPLHLHLLPLFPKTLLGNFLIKCSVSEMHSCPGGTKALTQTKTRTKGTINSTRTKAIPMDSWILILGTTWTTITISNLSNLTSTLTHSTAQSTQAGTNPLTTTGDDWWIKIQYYIHNINLRMFELIMLNFKTLPLTLIVFHVAVCLPE